MVARGLLCQLSGVWDWEQLSFKDSSPDQSLSVESVFTACQPFNLFLQLVKYEQGVNRRNTNQPPIEIYTALFGISKAKSCQEWWSVLLAPELGR